MPARDTDTYAKRELMSWGFAGSGQVEAKLALGDLGILDTPDDKKPSFDTYADGWLKDYARIE